AARRRRSSARVIRALSRVSGRRMAIGTPRLRIIWWPTARKVAADNWFMVRLWANQVPQNTPITRANKTIVVAWAARILTAPPRPSRRWRSGDFSRDITLGQAGGSGNPRILGSWAGQGP